MSALLLLLAEAEGSEDLELLGEYVADLLLLPLLSMSSDSMSALLLLLAEAEGSEDLELLVGEYVADLLLLLLTLPVVSVI